MCDRTSDNVISAFPSVRIVVWFQDDFALPIGSSAQTQKERVDWEGLARDWI